MLLTYLLITNVSISLALHLSGTTLVPDHPRSEVYTSFFHELIAEIATLNKFTFNLRTLAIAKYGGEPDEIRPQGLVGEVYFNRTDFIIADLAITEERSKWIQFTRPFMRSHLAALVTKPGNGTEPPNTLRQWLQQSKRLVVRNSLEEKYFRTSSNPMVYHLLPSSMPSFQNALHQLNSSIDFALIADSERLKLIAATECYLEVIEPNVEGAPSGEEIGDDFEVKYAIGLQKESPFFAMLENGLKALEESGQLQAMIDQHWTSYCEDKDEETNLATRPKLTLLLLAIAALLLLGWTVSL